MKTKERIGLKIGLFVPTMTTLQQPQQKAVPPLQLEIGVEVPTPLGLSEAGVAGGSDFLCPASHLSSFWQVWETKKSSSKGCDHFKGGLLSEFQKSTSIDKLFCNKEQVFEPGERRIFDKGGLSNYRQKSDNSSSKGHFPGILQSPVSCPQTRKEISYKYRIFCNKRPHPINRPPPPPLFSTFAKFIFRGFGPLNSQHFCDSGIPKNGAF